MCSNYRPVTNSQRLLNFFGVEAGSERRAVDVFPTGSAPFIRLTREGTVGGEPAMLVEDGLFGLLPHFATELTYGRRTYNARSETVAKLASFRQAWAHGQRCIIPAEHIYEPNWETGIGLALRSTPARCMITPAMLISSAATFSAAALQFASLVNPVTTCGASGSARVNP